MIPLTKENKRPLKAARGRGNQGDWMPNTLPSGELKEHRDWNAQVTERNRNKGKR